MERLCLRINHLIKEVSSAAISQKLIPNVVMSNFDKKIQKAWPDVKFRPVNGLSLVDLNHDIRQKEEWCKLEEGWVKINFDGASKGNGAIRDWICGLRLEGRYYGFWGSKN